MCLKARDSEDASKVLGYQTDPDAAHAWMGKNVKTREKRYAKLQGEKDKSDVKRSYTGQALVNERAKRLRCETELNGVEDSVWNSTTQYKELKLADGRRS
ncbi:hypothetical protein MPER_01742 [Moniliophthora perniciosa FA553]|nr:hypothetical protein MPER_01742 [Moniliophthora perniciosa FA553]